MILQGLTYLYFTLLIIISYKIYKWLKYRKIVNKMPGPPSYYLIGSLRLLICPHDQLFQTMRSFATNHYPVYKLWSSYICAINLLRAEDIEVLIGSMKHSTKSRVYSTLSPWLNQGLLTSSGEKWQFRRKLLTPTFHFNILQEFIKIFVEYSENLVRTLDENEGEEIDVVPIITQYTFHTIGESAMGTRIDQSQKSLEYVNAIYKMGELIIYRICRPWLFFDWIFFLCPSGKETLNAVNILHNFSRNVIRERQKDFKDIDIDSSHSDLGIKKRLAMLDLLISAKNSGEPIDDEGIREEVDTFMFEGHDTTTANISFALMLLANHPEIQNKVVEELYKIFENSNRAPTYRDLMDMKYLEMVLKEALRLYPSVPFISRITDEDITLPSGYMIPEQSIVHVHIFDLHRDETVYPNPEQFDPERFSPENCLDRHPFAYIPFSAGPRNCIGQKFALLEIKATICAILRNFKICPVYKPSDLQLVIDLILRSKNGVKMKFIKRQSLLDITYST